MAFWFSRGAMQPPISNLSYIEWMGPFTFRNLLRFSPPARIYWSYGQDYSTRRRACLLQAKTDEIWVIYIHDEQNAWKKSNA